MLALLALSVAIVPHARASNQDEAIAIASSIDADMHVSVRTIAAEQNTSAKCRRWHN